MSVSFGSSENVRISNKKCFSVNISTIEMFIPEHIFLVIRNLKRKFHKNYDIYAAVQRIVVPCHMEMTYNMEQLHLERQYAIQIDKTSYVGV